MACVLRKKNLQKYCFELLQMDDNTQIWAACPSGDYAIETHIFSKKHENAKFESSCYSMGSLGSSIWAALLFDGQFGQLQKSWAAEVLARQLTTADVFACPAIQNSFPLPKVNGQRWPFTSNSVHICTNHSTSG